MNIDVKTGFNRLLNSGQIELHHMEKIVSSYKAKAK